MKTAKISIDSIKDSDGWVELIHDLKYEAFVNFHSDLEEEEVSELFYDQVVSKTFQYGEYADITIEVDENLNIIGGKIHPFKS